MKQQKEYPLSDIIDSSISYNNFADFVRQKRKLCISSSGKEGISLQELAERLDADYGYFRKVVGMAKDKITKKRDLIIATCAALALDIEETNIGLRLYNNMLPLNVDDARDDMIMDLLESGEPHTVNEINLALTQAGFSPLDLITHKGQAHLVSNMNSTSYKVLETRVKTFMIDIMESGYNGRSRYDPENYRCNVACALDDYELNSRFLLYADTRDGFYSIKTSTGKYEPTTYYGSLDETGRYKEVFAVLNQRARKELSKLLDVLNDSRNYGSRLGARVENGQLHSYAESFNYSFPELNEYYLVDRVGNDTTLKVYKKSAYMSLYLSEDAYLAYYKRKRPEPIAVYSAIDDLEQARKEAKNRFEKDLLNERHYHFKQLLEKLNNHKEGLKTRKYVIIDTDMFFVFPGEYCSFYGVDKEFDCVSDPYDPSILFPQKDSAVIEIPGFDPVSLTVDELHRALELGITDIAEVCKIKKNLGSLEKIFD